MQSINSVSEAFGLICDCAINSYNSDIFYTLSNPGRGSTFFFLPSPIS